MPQNSPIDNQFPALESALTDPDGLLAVGGDLSCERLTTAYSLGIFPWYSDDQPIMWWSPDPRAVMHLDKLHLSRSLKKNMRQKNYQLTVNRDFEQVIRSCADVPRSKGHDEPSEESLNESEQTDDTWITEDMLEAYIALHHQKQAHSFEVWEGDELIGGLYGVATGGVFSGESMFHRRTDASKIAFVFTCMQIKKWGYTLLDCQIMNPHLKSLGVEELPREHFKRNLPGHSKDQASISIKAWCTLDWDNSYELANAYSDAQIERIS